MGFLGYQRGHWEQVSAEKAAAVFQDEADRAYEWWFAHQDRYPAVNWGPPARKHFHPDLDFLRDENNESRIFAEHDDNERKF